MKLLDLFSGAGGCAVGYKHAGFHVTGIDIKPQPHYAGDVFIQGDALEYLRANGYKYDVIHASPPCQHYSSLTYATGTKNNHPDMLDETRYELQVVGKPYVIENVEGAPLKNPLILCGTMFGLYVLRHRLFECSPRIFSQPTRCNHYLPVVKCGRSPKRFEQFHSVAGHFPDLDYAKIAMGIDWMNQKELAQAIPPAYTEFIGNRIKALMEIRKYINLRQN